MIRSARRLLRPAKRIGLLLLTALVAILALRLPACAGDGDTGHRTYPLHPVSLGKAGLVIEGQVGALQFDMPLPRTVPVQQVDLSFTYQSSIDVMPEGSRLRLSLNDTPLALLPVSPKPVTATLHLSEDIVRPGANTLTFDVLQQHRVSCSLDGTYELWTRVVPSKSYYHPVLTRPLPPDSLSAFADALSLPGGTDAPFVILTPPVPSPDSITWGGLAAQGIALRRHSGTPAVTAHAYPLATTRSESGDLPGLDGTALGTDLALLIGTKSDLAPLLSPALTAAITGPFLAVRSLPRAKDMAPARLLILSGPSPADVRYAAARFAQTTRPLADLDHMIAEPTLSWAEDPGSTRARSFSNPVTLAELGVKPFNVSGLRAGLHIPVTLPRGYLPTDLIPVDFRLEIAHETSLGPGSRISVLVNGQTAAGIEPERHQTGGILPPRHLMLPATAFHPGENDVMVEVSLPPAADSSSCPMPGDAPRFTLFNSSSLEFPLHALLNKLPNLRLTADQGFPYARKGGNPVDLVVSRQGGLDGLSAAWSLVGAIAKARGGSFPITGSLRVNHLSTRDMILVAPSSALPSAALQAVSAPFGSPARLWPHPLNEQPVMSLGEAEDPQQRTNAALAQLRALRTENRIADGKGPQALGLRSPDPADAKAYWLQHADQDKASPAAAAAATGGPAKDSSLTDTLLSLLRQGGETAPGFIPEGAVPLGLLAQFQSPQATMSTWTVLTAADKAHLSESSALLVSPEAWHSLNGAAALISRQGVFSTPPSDAAVYIAELPPLTLENLWLLASVLLSHFVVVWVVLVVLSTVLLGGVTWVLVRNAPKTREETRP